MSPIQKRAAAALAIIGFSLALWPLVVWYVRRMADGSDEPLGLVALVAAAVFAWGGRRRLTGAETGRPLALPMLVGYGLLVWLEFPPLLRSLPAIGALVAWFGLWRLPAVVVLLGLSLPVMASLQFYLGFPLRLFTAETASLVLNLVGVDVVRAGAQLVHDGAAVGVDAPCSGVRMLWASGFLATALAGKFRLGWRATIGLGAGACLLAIFANAIRACLLFFPESGIVAVPHWTHEATGALCFAIGVAALVASARKLEVNFALVSS